MMKIAKHFDFNLIDFSDQFKDFEVISFKINYKNQIMILGKQISSLITEENHKYKILIIGPNKIEEVSIISPELNLTHSDILSDEIILLNCRTHKELNNNPNLKILDFNGNFKREFSIGDGVEDIQTNANGDIWTTYFDEGIFSNDRIGKNGLNCWNKFGKLTYEFIPSENLGHPYDFGALNIVNDYVWISYYCSNETYPIVRIKNKKEIKYWNNDIYGFDTFALFNNYILISNSYKLKPFYLIELLENNKNKIKGKFFFFDENNKPLNEEEVKMRKDLICFRRGYKLYIANLKEVLI